RPSRSMVDSEASISAGGALLRTAFIHPAKRFEDEELRARGDRPLRWQLARLLEVISAALGGERREEGFLSGHAAPVLGVAHAAFFEIERAAGLVVLDHEDPAHRVRRDELDHVREHLPLDRAAERRVLGAAARRALIARHEPVFDAREPRLEAA